MPKGKQTLPTSDVPKFWNVITAEDADSAEITMYGDIVSRRPRDWWTGEEIDGQFITPEEFAEDLERIKGKSQITIKINSSGGEVYTAIAIHNALRALAGHKTVVVEGIAASAASVIMCAGDEVQVYPGSIVMIHGVRSWFDESMTLPEVRKAAKMMDATEKAMAAIYATKTGLSEEELRKLMFAETWMTGQQAIDRKFADALIDGAPVQAALCADKHILLVAGIRHDVRDCRNIPKNIPIDSAAAPVTAGDTKNKKEVIHMTEKELREQYAEIVAEIETAAAARATEKAAADERARIRDIEAIEGQIADKELVNNAKYGEKPQTAEQLALAAMKAQAAAAHEFLGKMEEDDKASGASKVKVPANGGNADNGDAAKAALEGGLAAYKKMKGRA